MSLSCHQLVAGLSLKSRALKRWRIRGAQGGLEWSVPRSRLKLLSIAVALVLAGTPEYAKGETPQAQDTAPVTFSKGLRASIGNGKVSAAKIVFTNEGVTVEPKGAYPVYFDYDNLRVQRGRPQNDKLPIFDKHILLASLPSVVLGLVTGGLSTYLMTYLGVSTSLWLFHRVGGQRNRHWASLHSEGEHQCTFILLPRSKRLRQAIFEELERRDKRELIVRLPELVMPNKPPPVPSVGESAPDFALLALDGSAWRLSEMKGKTVLLNFWASWCGPCHEELPQLELLHRRLMNEGVVVLGVADEKPDDARRFIEQEGITFPTLHDERGYVFSRYQVSFIPTSIIIGPDGRMLARIEGFRKGALAKALKTGSASQTVKQD